MIFNIANGDRVLIELENNPYFTGEAIVSRVKSGGTMEVKLTGPLKEFKEGDIIIVDNEEIKSRIKE